MNTLKSHTNSLAAVLVLALCLGSGCRFENTPTEEELGGHRVSIRPSCQGSSKRSHHHQEADGSSRVLFYEFTCGDTKILIRDNTLSVNGKSYGALNEGDRINVDYGKVRVNSEVRTEVPMPFQ